MLVCGLLTHWPYAHRWDTQVDDSADMAQQSTDDEECGWDACHLLVTAVDDCGMFEGAEREQCMWMRVKKMMMSDMDRLPHKHTDCLLCSLSIFCLCSAVSLSSIHKQTEKWVSSDVIQTCILSHLFFFLCLHTLLCLMSLCSSVLMLLSHLSVSDQLVFSFCSHASTHSLLPSQWPQPSACIWTGCMCVDASDRTRDRVQGDGCVWVCVWCYLWVFLLTRSSNNQCQWVASVVSVCVLSLIQCTVFWWLTDRWSSNMDVCLVCG